MFCCYNIQQQQTIAIWNPNCKNKVHLDLVHLENGPLMNFTSTIFVSANAHNFKHLTGVNITPSFFSIFSGTRLSFFIFLFSPNEQTALE